MIVLESIFNLFFDFAPGAARESDAPFAVADS